MCALVGIRIQTRFNKNVSSCESTGTKVPGMWFVFEEIRIYCMNDTSLNDYPSCRFFASGLLLSRIRATRWPVVEGTSLEAVINSLPVNALGIVVSSRVCVANRATEFAPPHIPKQDALAWEGVIVLYVCIYIYKRRSRGETALPSNSFNLNTREGKKKKEKGTESAREKKIM